MDATILIIFLFVYLGMILGGLPGLALDRTGVALLGAIALIALGKIAPEAALSLGDVPVVGEDEHFPVNAPAEKAKFVIRAEKAANRRGIEMILEAAGGNVIPREDLWARAGKGEFKALWIVGGYSPDVAWPGKELVAAAGKTPLLIVQTMFANDLTLAAAIVLPSCAWVEREGTFVNAAGRVQPFERAIAPPDGARTDGQYLYAMAGYQGLYRAERVREAMAAAVPAMAGPAEAPRMPAHQH